MNVSPDARRLEQTLATLWTIRDVSRAFGRTPMTINTWRRDRHLPSIEVPGDRRPAIRFIPEDVIKWAASNHEEIKPPVKRYRTRRA